MHIPLPDADRHRNGIKQDAAHEFTDQDDEKREINSAGGKSHKLFHALLIEHIGQEGGADCRKKPVQEHGNTVRDREHLGGSLPGLAASGQARQVLRQENQLQYDHRYGEHTQAAEQGNRNFQRLLAFGCKTDGGGKWCWGLSAEKLLLLQLLTIHCS